MLRSLAFIACLCFGFWSIFPNLPTTTDDSAETRFKTYCANCHKDGENSFINRVWKYGNTKPQILKTIKEGKAEAGMPAFGETFSDTQIEALIDYVEKYAETASKKAKVSNKAGIFKTNTFTLKLDTIAKGMNNPWGMTFLPNGDLLATDRSGQIYRINAKRERTEIAGAPAVLEQGQGGLLDIVLHPKFKTNNILYVSYSKLKDSTGAKWATTAIMQAKLDGNKLIDQKDIFVAQPYIRTRHHYGSRIVFDKQGYMFFSVGERGEHFKWPQKLSNDLGKIHRLHDDGRVPVDNPFVKIDSARGSIWSYGHRNPQGLLIDPKTGIIWENEHGPMGGDELNIIRKAQNFGWPVISYGINYDGSILTKFTAKEGMTQPEHYWIPSIGACDMAQINSNKYKGWEGNFLIGSMSFEYLNRCKIVGNKVVEQEKLLPQIGRVRCVEIGPDGYIYVGVEKPGFIVRLLPM